MKLPKIRFTKKVVAIGAAAGIAMGAAGIAAAYFSSTGTGTGNSNVGHPTQFAVTQQGPPIGTMYPNHTASVQKFDITNKGKGTQHYTVVAGNASVEGVAASVTGPKFIVTTSTGDAVPGCYQAWFTATAAVISGTLTPTAIVTDTVTVRMNNGTGVPNAGANTQDVCQGTHPKIILHVGS